MKSRRLMIFSQGSGHSKTGPRRLISARLCGGLKRGQRTSSEHGPRSWAASRNSISSINDINDGRRQGRASYSLASTWAIVGDQLVRVYGNTAVNTGYYTFSYMKDGEAKSIPARYSFTYVKDGNEWKIVDH